jgi:FG-GAP-like repeat/FG-GAP repeat
MQARMGCAGCLALALIVAGCQSDSVAGPNGQSTAPDVAAPAAPSMTEAPAAPVSPAPEPDPVSPEPASPQPAAPEPAAPEPAAPQPTAPANAPGMAATSPVHSLFSATRGEDLMLGTPLGDIDGDGLDDFVIMTMLPRPNDGMFPLFGPEAHTYLYYGRANFPARLSTDDADAMFASVAGGGGQLGDLNGDGYADFGIQRRTGVEIIFGSPQRLRGTIAEGTASVRWMVPPTPPELVGQIFMELYVMGVGDYNADGCDDLAVLATRKLDPLEAVFDPNFGFTTSAYLVLGHAGDWPSAEWDPSWAVARFGDQHVAEDPATGMQAYDYPLMPTPAGDLDGDGHDDLVAAGAGQAFLFYGGRALSGVVGPSQADATIAHEVYVQLTALGDADGDGAADLMVSTRESTMQVLYGRRWSGAISLQPDLTIDVGETGGGPGYAAAGDLDGDGKPEIVVAVPMSGYGFSSNIARPARGALYEIRGTGTRAVGTYSLTEENLLMRGPLAGAREAGASEGGLGTTLSMSGDINGDGAPDILATAPGAILSSQSLGALFLVPSTRRTPL